MLRDHGGVVFRVVRFSENIQKRPAHTTIYARPAAGAACALMTSARIVIGGGTYSTIHICSSSSRSHKKLMLVWCIQRKLCNAPRPVLSWIVAPSCYR